MTDHEEGALGRMSDAIASLQAMWETQVAPLAEAPIWSFEGVAA